MSDLNRPREFLSLRSREYASDEDLGQNPVQPALDTLFSEFARRHRSLSPSTQSSPRSVRGPLRPTQQQMGKPSNIDLRALDYTSQYDSHLMCPICHIPFVEPVVLDCDHTFCASCYNEYRAGATSSERSQCPSCRTLVLSSPRRASRLIYNMCSDIKVRCPNDACEAILERGYIEHHAVRDCLEQKLACPDPKCDKQTKRKHYVPGQCVHENRVECDCGAIIELGKGEWLRHKDESCSKTGKICESCGKRVLLTGTQTDHGHECLLQEGNQQCPGADFGCIDTISSDELRDHTSNCVFARLAPHLKTQARLLQNTADELASSKLRNQNLEGELERLNSLLMTQIQPRLDHLTLASHSDTQHDELLEHENDIEEIHRDTIPSAAAIHHRDLLLPAHIRDLTPSPDLLSSTGFSSSHHQHTTTIHNQAHMNNHLLSLHESLRHSVSNLEADISSLHHAMSELDARTSMQLINETLRIKEDLAYTNAALVSHRSQMQWLLNRERIGREQALLRERGRLGGTQQAQQPQSQAAQGGGSSSGATSDTMERQSSNSVMSPPSLTSSGTSQNDAYPFPSSGTGMTRTVSGNGSGSGPSSAATSPMFTGIGAGGSRRPSMRGGSQERVKL